MRLCFKLVNILKTNQLCSSLSRTKLTFSLLSSVCRLRWSISVLTGDLGRSRWEKIWSTGDIKWRRDYLIADSCHARFWVFSPAGGSSVASCEVSGTQTSPHVSRSPSQTDQLWNIYFTNYSLKKNTNKLLSLGQLRLMRRHWIFHQSVYLLHQHLTWLIYFSRSSHRQEYHNRHQTRRNYTSHIRVNISKKINALTIKFLCF